MKRRKIIRKVGMILGNSNNTIKEIKRNRKRSGGDERKRKRTHEIKRETQNERKTTTRERKQ